MMEWLLRTPVFAAVASREVEKLARAGTKRKLKKRAILFQREQKIDSLALVLSGRMDIVRDTAGGEHVVLRSLGAGSLIGVSAIAGAPHSANVVAGVASEVLLLPGRAVRSLFGRAPEAALSSIVHLATLLSELSDDVEELRLPSIEERLRRRLLRMGRGRRELTITHEELASLIGATRPNVSRALSRLESKGVIRRHRGRIELT